MFPEYCITKNSDRENFYEFGELNIICKYISQQSVKIFDSVVNKYFLVAMYRHDAAEVVSTYEEETLFFDREFQWLVSNLLTTGKKLVTVKDEEGVSAIL